MMNRLKGLSAVVTGATSGIGLAVAEELSRQGVNLLIHGRDPEKLSEISMKLKCITVCGDINDPKIAENLLSKITQKYGNCDIVINNAGVIETGNIESIDINKVTEMVKTNVEAAYRIIYIFLKYFKKQNKGSVINISSVMGTKVRETAGAYAGTKYAIEALSEALRMELAKTNIKIICIEPGLVATELHRNWETHPSESMNIPDPLLPQDVAKTICYILQQDNRVRIPRIMILPKDHII